MPPIRKRATAIAQAHWKDLGLWMPIFLGVPVLGFGLGYWLDSLWPVVVSWVAVSPIPVFGLIRHYRRFAKMPCEDCGRILERGVPADGAPIVFHCPDCNIEWDTGFIQGGGD